jgi:hypothetical protein
MSRKVLFVGVGGSGSKTLSFLKQTLQYRLEAAGGDPDRLPRAWQFVAIDLPPVEQQIPGVPSVLNGDAEYLGVATSSKYYPMYDDELMGAEILRGDFNRWRVNPMEVDQLPWLGAGQRRVVGRVAVASAVSVIRNRIASAATALNSVDTNQEFLDLPEAVRGNTQLEPIVLVVGSLGGGSGSGGLLDVCRIVEAQLREDVMTFAYLPSVFNNLSPDARSGIPGNTYFAMSEMLNAIWDRAGDSSFLRRSGMEPFVSEMTGRGPAYPIVIGRGSTGLDTDLQIFSAVAALLTEFILDERYSTSFEASIVNDFANPPISMASPLFRNTRMPTVSLGFSRFGLGRARFGRYCAERLTHTALRVIARGHVELANANEQTKALAERTGLDAGRGVLKYERDTAGETDGDGTQLGDNDPVVRFARACGLSERGEGADNDQVIDFLYSPDEFITKEADLLRHVMDRTRQGANQLPPMTWLQQFKNALGLQGATHNEAEFMRAVDDHMNTKAQEWSAAIPEMFRKEVTSYLVTKGGWYTVALCEALDAYIDGAVSELRSEVAQQSEDIDKAASEAQRIVAAIKAKTVGVDHDGIRRSVDLYYRSRLGGQFAVQRRLKAVAVLTSFQTNYLKRVIKALTEAMQGVRSIVDSEEFANLSSARPSVRLRAPATEFLVLAPDDYEEQFDELVSSLPGGGIRDELLKAFFKDEPNKSRAVRRMQLVDFGDLGAARDPQARAVVNINIGVQRFIDRAYAWFNSEDNALGNYIKSDINRYVDDPEISDDERRSRIERLTNVFGQALVTGQPLVDADPAILQRMTNSGGASLGTSLSMSTLPFSMDSGVGRAFADVLRRHGVDDSGLAGYFATPGSPIQLSDTINIATNSVAMHPVCLVDYQRAIAERWLEEQGRGGGDFGTHRRAMRREEAIPLPRESVVALAAGWDVGRALGSVRVSSVTPDAISGPFVPKVLHEGSWQSFPDVSPEGPAYQASEGFALMIESFGMAQIVGALSVNPLAPYEALHGLGSVSVADLPGGPLRDWLVTGTFPSGNAQELVPETIAEAGPSVTARIAALRAWLAGERDRQLALSERSPSEDYADRQHDLASLRHAGLGRLVEALKGWERVLEANAGSVARTADGSVAAD